MPAVFKCNSAGTCHKGNRAWVHTFLLLLSNHFKCLLSLTAFHMSQYQGSPSDHISRWHLVEYSVSILHAPTFGIHVNQATPHKDIGLTPTLNYLFMSPSAPSAASSAHKLAHALSSGTKVHLSGVVPFCCISWKSSTVFSCCPTLAYLASLFYSTKRCPIVQCLVPWKPASMPPIGAFVDPQARARPVSSNA
jgi:hypothetical protein